GGEECSAGLGVDARVSKMIRETVEDRTRCVHERYCSAQQRNLRCTSCLTTGERGERLTHRCPDELPVGAVLHHTAESVVDGRHCCRAVTRCHHVPVVVPGVAVQVILKQFAVGVVHRRCSTGQGSEPVAACIV